MRPRLRLFGDAPFEGGEPVTPPTVTMPLADLVSVLRDAVETDRVWLEDFGDEEISVSEDLYEILSAYNRLRSAA